MDKDTNTNNEQLAPATPDKHGATSSDMRPKDRASKKKLFIIIGVAALVVIVLAGGVFAIVANKDKNGQNSGNGGQQSADNQNPWLAGCQGDERVPMTNLPMDMADVASITPVGLTAGAHVTPIDHLYFFPKDMRNRDAAPVYAMADGYIVDISKREVNVDQGTSRPAEYRVAIQHSCQTVSYFDLMTSLDPAILAEFEKSGGRSSGYRIPVKAGQEIGRVGAQSLDTAVYNFAMTLPGFISPEKYKGEFWKVHTDDFFSYFSAEHNAAMQAKNIRKVAPLSGKIDYDQAGKLIGNWFREGTDYFGDGTQTVSADGKHGYWSGHLAIFPFVIDGSTTIVSFGEYGDGSPQAFAVKGNSPNPATVGVDSGVVAYELVQAPQPTPTGMNPAGNQVVGTVLFQVLDGEKLKMEVFPGKTKAQATAFTSAAQIYER